MTSTADNELDRATKSKATRVYWTRSKQCNPDTVDIHQFVYRFFALPPEIREMVYCFVGDGDPRIKLGGSQPNGIMSLMLAMKDHRLRSSAVGAVWRTCSIEWEGSLKSRAWQRFKRTAIPHIRCLTINFESISETYFNDDSEIRQTLAWMWRRGKRGNRARYTWHLEQLHLVGLNYSKSFSGLGVAGWYIWEQCPFPGCKHWSEHFSLTRLRKDGLKVTVEQQFAWRRLRPVGQR